MNTFNFVWQIEYWNSSWIDLDNTNIVVPSQNWRITYRDWFFSLSLSLPLFPFSFLSPFLPCWLSTWPLSLASWEGTVVGLEGSCPLVLTEVQCFSQIRSVRCLHQNLILGAYKKYTLLGSSLDLQNLESGTYSVEICIFNKHPRWFLYTIEFHGHFFSFYL